MSCEQVGEVSILRHCCTSPLLCRRWARDQGGQQGSLLQDRDGGDRGHPGLWPPRSCDRPQGLPGQGQGRREADRRVQRERGLHPASPLRCQKNLQVSDAASRQRETGVAMSRVKRTTRKPNSKRLNSFPVAPTRHSTMREIFLFFLIHHSYILNIFHTVMHLSSDQEGPYSLRTAA